MSCRLCLVGQAPRLLHAGSPGKVTVGAFMLDPRFSCSHSRYIFFNLLVKEEENGLFRRLPDTFERAMSRSDLGLLHGEHQAEPGAPDAQLLQLVR